MPIEGGSAYILTKSGFDSLLVDPAADALSSSDIIFVGAGNDYNLDLDSDVIVGGEDYDDIHNCD